MTTKEQRHRLVDAVPEPVLDEAEQLPRELQQRATDPLLQTLTAVPEDDEPETEEERAAIARGKVEPWEHVRTELLRRNR
jgi:hypothetical protein